MYKDIVVNKKAGFNFELFDRYEAGIVLQGWEVKAIRQNRISMPTGYVAISADGQAVLTGIEISPLMQKSSHIEADPKRDRVLLLKKSIIQSLVGSVAQKGMTIVPVKLYWKDNLIKCEVALAKGKNFADKRQAEREKDADRQAQRALKNYVR